MLAVAAVEKKLSALFRLAIRSGATEAIALHIRRGEPVNGRDGGGLTPLMLAAMHGLLGVCNVLLDEGADPELVDRQGRTARDLAVEHGHGSVAELIACFCGEVSRVVPESGATVTSEQTTDRSVEPSCNPVADDVRLPAGPPAPATDVLHAAANDTDVLVLGDVVEDAGGWLPGETVVSPGHDADCAAAASQLQKVLSRNRRSHTEANRDALVALGVGQQAAIAVLGKYRTGVACGALDHVAVAMFDQHVGDGVAEAAAA